MVSVAEAGAGRSTSRRLVGRDDALDRLEARLDDAIEAGRLGTALVEGPAGIGKTRVVEELTKRLQVRGVDVLVGHCVAQGGQTLPYAPLVELLADLLRREGATAVRRWAGPAAVELGRLAPALLAPGEKPTSGSLGASRLFQALSELLQQLSFRRPVVLVVEDVHWADVSTRELLALLARQQHGAVLLLLTLRTDESTAPPGLARYLAELARRGDQHVRLAPLTRDEQAQQMSDILGLPPRRQLLDEVYARAEGNPFFAEELLALGAGSGELPSTIRDLLLARLEALRPATRQVLRTASLIGREVPHRLLEAAVDVRGERLEAALREAVDAHVLQARTETLVFRHALLQEAVAGSLLPGEAARSHRRLADALTASPDLAGPRPTGVAGRVARHWDAAGESGQALVASVAAAREASGALAFAESLSHYERALELLNEVDDGQRLLDLPRPRLLRWVAEVAHLAAHPELATRLIREALDCCDPEDHTLRGWLHERLGRYLWMSGDGQAALIAYQEAVQLVPELPPTRARAAVLSGLSQILMLADRYAESEQTAREAIAVARKVPDGRSIEGHARCNLGVDLAFQGRVDDGIAELREAIRIADEELDDVDENARALVNLNGVYLLDGRMEDAAATALEGVRVGDELGLRRRKGVWCRCDAAQILMLLCRYDDAERLLVEGGALDPQGVDAFRLDLVEGQLRLRQGALDEARATLERGRSRAGLLLDPQLLAPLYTALTECAVAQGDVLVGAELFAEGLARLPDSWHPFFEVPLRAAGITAAMGHHPPAVTEAEEQLARAMKSAAAVHHRPPHVEAELRTAAATISGSPDAWAEAASAWDALGDRYRAATARARGAETLLVAGNDRQVAASLLDSALAEARAIGAHHLEALAEDLGRRSRLKLVMATAADNPYRLTAREAEVLALVAEGLSDRDIGTRLFISHRTVERHVSNLLAKLDAARRSELVATALREGLLDDSSAV
jgi:DNA-binding CsgD family transcriptional regulator/tetratricopeptide (TPR) repeat protein